MNKEEIEKRLMLLCKNKEDLPGLHNRPVNSYHPDHPEYITLALFLGYRGSDTGQEFLRESCKGLFAYFPSLDDDDSRRSGYSVLNVYLRHDCLKSFLDLCASFCNAGFHIGSCFTVQLYSSSIYGFSLEKGDLLSWSRDNGVKPLEPEMEIVLEKLLS